MVLGGHRERGRERAACGRERTDELGSGVELPCRHYRKPGAARNALPYRTERIHRPHDRRSGRQRPCADLQEAGRFLKKTPSLENALSAMAFCLPVAQTECECRSARRDIADALFEEPVEKDILVDRPGGKGDAAVLQRFDEAARDEHLIHVDRRDAVFAADFRDDLGGGQLEIRNVAVVQVEVGDVLLDVEVDLGAVVQLGVRGEDARVDRAG